MLTSPVAEPDAATHTPTAKSASVAADAVARGIAEPSPSLAGVGTCISSLPAAGRNWKLRLLAPLRHQPRVLAIASGGGHWIQLSRVMRGFHSVEDVELAYVTTLDGYRSHVDGRRFYVIQDGNRHKKLACLVAALQLVLVLIRERPDVVITTGAACGYLCIRIARLLGARTVWIDSIANAHELSGSGKLVGPYADLWLTQWPELARANGPHFMGSVL